ncbi:MAG: hypothetical protein NTZ13_02370 [Candidatus Parcubacteria bacterium]|nr:hypothetical protein [Candidatus Parcubacteria bacterium]
MNDVLPNPKKVLTILMVVLALIVVVFFTLSGEPFWRTGVLILLLSLIRVPGLLISSVGKKKCVVRSKRARRKALLKK